jgi:hypothetical protein
VIPECEASIILFEDWTCQNKIYIWIVW